MESVHMERIDIRHTPGKNPYFLLASSILDEIGKERDIQLAGTVEEKSLQLNEYDIIYPDWISGIYTKTIVNFHILTRLKLYVFGAINGISFNKTETVENKTLVAYIRINIIRNRNGGNKNIEILVRSINPNDLDIFSDMIGIDKKYLFLIDVEQLITAIINGNNKHIYMTRIIEIFDRLTFLLTHPNVILIGKLYKINGIREKWIEVAKSKPSQMEHIVLELNRDSAEEICNLFGMVIPLGRSNEIYEYLYENITEYEHVIGRDPKTVPIRLNMGIHTEENKIKENFSKMKDNEIIKHIGSYVAYSSRMNLVWSMVSLFRTSQFLYPIVRDIERSINRTTINLSDILDSSVFMVGFGTTLKYETYEIEDLIGAFFDDDVEGIKFRRPENTDKMFSMTDINGLTKLLDCFPKNREIEKLLVLIAEGKRIIADGLEYDAKAIKWLNVLNDTSKKLVKEFLLQVFYIGMYMRRWEGPGYVYPLKHDTTIKDTNPEKKVIDNLVIGNTILEMMDNEVRKLALSLHTCEYNKLGEVEDTRVLFSIDWEKVVEGKECIRIASSKFIGTAVHYMRVLYKEKIVGVKVEDVDKIA